MTKGFVTTFRKCKSIVSCFDIGVQAQTLANMPQTFYAFQIKSKANQYFEMYKALKLLLRR